MRQMTARQLQRRDTAASWAAENPVLLDGEIGYESDTGRFKFGDGVTAWQALSYRGGVATVNGAAPDEDGNVQVSGGGGAADVRLVIRTQEEFDTMIATPDWLGAHSVLLAGAFSYTDTTGAGLLVPENVYCIDGVNNAEITALSSVLMVLRYETCPDDGLHRVSGITVSSTGTACGFSNMTGLICCTVQRCSVGFSACRDLVNCTANIQTMGFSSCYSLTNCTAHIGRASLGTCFSNCSRLTNCSAVVERGTIGYGFSTCAYLCNCFAEVFTTGTCVAFQNCKYCSCCAAGSLGPNGVIWAGQQNRCDDTCLLT